MDRNSHIIESQVLEVETTRQVDAFAFQRRLRTLYYQDLLPRIEALFDRYTPAGEVIRMDKMAVEVLVVGSADWETAFVEATLRQLESTLQQSPAAPKGAHSSGENDDTYDALGSLVYFLEHGTMPWYARGKNLAAVESELLRISVAELGTTLRPMILEERTMRERAVFQLSDALLAALFPGAALQFLKAWTLRYAAHPDELRARVLFWKAVVDTEARRRPSSRLTDNQVLGSYIRRHTGEEREGLYARLPAAVRAQAEAALSETSKESYPAPEPGNGEAGPRGRKKEAGADPLFIDNAGLVILHPFLEPFFERVGLCREHRFVSAEAQRRAVLLTRYIVSPGQEIPEYVLSLNKLLCGYPPDETLENRITVSEEENAEIAGLLSSVTGHWKMHGVAVLTTEEHLREAFLQRTGKLCSRTDGWLLQVTVKSYDIVMNGLPWGIGTIRLPWMEAMLHVEWC